MRLKQNDIITLCNVNTSYQENIKIIKFMMSQNVFNLRIHDILDKTIIIIPKLMTREIRLKTHRRVVKSLHSL